METVSDEVWDVVIAGTSIPQSLLALSLSRSGKKILHVDRHGYYGGDDAGLSLQDAEIWARESSQAGNSVFKKASISTPQQVDQEHSPNALASSRSYTLSLNPQIIYAQSAFLPKLVSSRIHTQLEFLAVGSWWIHRDGALRRIPSTREDVFNDESLSMKDKRGLMKFLRYVLQEEEGQSLDVQEDSRLTLQDALASKFKVPETLQAPLQALALSSLPPSSIPFEAALARTRRHMRSMGYFGPGFGAVVAKYGGNSEISQVACRAGAVGGAVYLLGHGIQSFETTTQLSASSTDESSGRDTALIESVLSDGTHVKSKVLVGSLDDLPKVDDEGSESMPATGTYRSINIVAHPLHDLFPQTADNGPVPAVAIVLVDSGNNSAASPIYLQIHSEDTGECPHGQCVVYASVAGHDSSSKGRLQNALDEFLAACGARESVLWTLSYLVSEPSLDMYQELPTVKKISEQVFSFNASPHDIAFPDGVLASVEEVWKSVLGIDVRDEVFLRFDERETEADDE